MILTAKSKDWNEKASECHLSTTYLVWSGLGLRLYLRHDSPKPLHGLTADAVLQLCSLGKIIVCKFRAINTWSLKYRSGQMLGTDVPENTVLFGNVKCDC